jgi:nitrate reductase NapE component
MAAARVALAAGETAPAQPSFAVSSTGLWSILGVAVVVGIAVWGFKKVT